MTFIYPLGLLGLIGVPIVILIYILKNKFNEQTVPSTYLWTLSEKFFKRRNPLSGLTGIINLILQILMITLVSLAIARPVFVIPNSASEYCFILDCSGSMNMTTDGKVRFDSAKDEISEIINSSVGGSQYTLVAVSGVTNTVYERVKDKKIALDMLNGVECTDGKAPATDALAIAQKYFDENDSLVTYLFTDKNYSTHNGVKIVNVSSQNDENYSVNDVKSTFIGNNLSVTANVTSYKNDATLTVEFYVNGAESPSDTKEVAVKASEPSEVAFSYETASYTSFKIAITNKDALSADNEFISYNQQSKSIYDILIVSQTPFFFEAAFDVLTDSKVDVISPEDYKEQSGYGLYVFHSYTPKTLPDAAVWLVNSTKSVEESGFGIRGIGELEEPAEIVKSESTASAARALLEGVDGKDIFISEYVKYSGMYTKFTTLFTYDSNPLIFAGANALGNREVVIGFDVHKANISLTSDFVALLGNLLYYSCPDVLDKTGYDAGEDVNINISSNATSVKGISPDGEEIYVDASSDVGVLHLDKVGTYTVRVTTPDAVEEYKLYSSAPASESDVTERGASFSLAGTLGNLKTDGEYDPVVIVFVLLAVVFSADWMVYCYEKYQLR